MKYSITKTRNGFEVRILKRGKLVIAPQEFTTRLECINHVNSYAILKGKIINSK